MEKLLECEITSRSAKNAQIIVAIPLGLMASYLMINIIHAAFGKRLFMEEFFWVAILFFVICTIAEILIWHYTRGQITITKSLGNILQIEIRLPSGLSASDKGKWSCEGIYMKQYARYGMYKKHLGLNLFCNGKPACFLRHSLGNFDTAPEHFTEVNTLYNHSDTEYWCKKIKQIEEIIRETNPDQ